MKYAFVCPKCKDVFSKEMKTPYDPPACPTCDLQMHYLGATADAWHNMTQNEKADLKQEILKEYEMPQTMYLKRLSNDMHTIRNIIIFFLVLFLCSGIIRAILNFG